jgi:hypothetical protein
MAQKREHKEIIELIVRKVSKLQQTSLKIKEFSLIKQCSIVLD